VLQPINPNTRAPLSGPLGEALPAGFAQAQAGAGETPAFDLQLALHGFVAAAPTAPESAAVESASVGEADAEQWLANVLGQQAVRVEARETAQTPEAAEAAAARVEPMAPLLLPAAVEPAPVGEADAEQWPANMLGQQAVRVEARETAQMSEEPLPAQVQLPLPPRETPAGLPMPALELPLAGRQVQPLPVQPAALPPALAGEPLAPAASLALGGENSFDAGLLDRLPSAAGEGEPAAPSSAAASQPAPQPLASERSLKLPAAQAPWGEQMLHSLREQVELQINQRIQNATIRLDPPELGSLEIYLSHESGRLNVQLSAANGEVARLLQQSSERLRQELLGQHFVQVSVQVSADAQGGRQHQQAPRQAWRGDEPVQAAGDSAASVAPRARESASDVLVTV
jgi:flagellar hook-length control protein FliK